MMFKKAQAAMEFLMTYGWAILVVLAAIGALAYFGVLSPDRFLPEKCTMPSGIACLDFTVDGTNSEVTLSVQNAGGFDMSTPNITLTSVTPATVSCNVTSIGATLANGEKATPVISCSGISALSSNTKIKGSLVMEYVNSETGLAHTKTGELIAKRP